MKKLLSICLIIMTLTSTSYAVSPSRDVTSLYRTIPEIEISVYENLSKTAYSILTLYCKKYINAGLGSNSHIDEAMILHLNNEQYQLVTFYFPISYRNCQVMAIFFNTNIWIRTGILTDDGGVIFDITEVSGKNVEMFLFSNL